MPLPIKSRYTIHEAARYIASATGEKITISQIIDWGTQGFYGLYLLTNDCHVKYEDAADVVEISGALVKFHPNATQAATLENGYPIEIESGLHEGRKVIFMKSPMQLHHNKFGEKENPAVFNSTSMVLLGTELTDFTASIAKPQQADNQTSKPANAPAAKVEAGAGTSPSPSGDAWEVQARVIADECFDADTKGGCRDSLKGYSKRVMELMQERGIKGARGIIDNANHVMREALQSDLWWKKKSK